MQAGTCMHCGHCIVSLSTLVCLTPVYPIAQAFSHRCIVPLYDASHLDILALYEASHLRILVLKDAPHMCILVLYDASYLCILVLKDASRMCILVLKDASHMCILVLGCLTLVYPSTEDVLHVPGDGLLPLSCSPWGLATA
jgi:hypothetical protein